jgi:hypothetical protein
MTALLDINGVVTLNSLHPTAARTTTTNGSAVDVRSQKGIAPVILDSAAGTGTSPTLDVKIQDSADGSTSWADVTGATFTQVINAASQQKIGLDLDATRGYIRAVATIGGTSPSFTFSVSALGRTF